MTQSPLSVIVLAAGQGTRMKSSTPKVLHEIAGVPLLGHVLATAQQLEPQNLVVVLRHERDRLATAVADLAPEATIADQDELPGTGRAVQCALDALPSDVTGDVLVLSGDVPLLDAETLRGLLAVHRAAAAGGTVLTALLEDPTGYGRLVRTETGDVDRIVEHKDATAAEREIREINSGTYVFDAAALREHLPRLSDDNAQKERYLTDMVGLLREGGMPVAAVPAAAEWLVAGVNDRVQLGEAARRLNDLVVRGWQRAGVTVQDPATTWIDLTVTLAEDVTVLPNTQLHGSTSIGRGATIGPDTTLRDVEVGEGAAVRRTDASSSRIGAGASVGPFSYLRPGTDLGADGKIGAFVETKSATIGRGSKVPHLSYVGDAEVGEGANVGAGTIVANYDGVNKHRTVVGDHVRTGAHNVFVAPVRIGAGAYTGAGTVVRNDVPPGALSITVAPQRHREGWVAEHRPDTAAARAAESEHE